MTPIVWLCVFTAGAALAQDAAGPGALAALEADARLKTATWEKLAQAMESSVSRLLPCDAKAPATISAASQSSDARLAAVAADLQAAEQQASGERASAQRVLASAQRLVSELATERSDVAQEQSAIDGQLVNLAESVKKHAALGDAQRILLQIQALAGQRAMLAQSGQERQEGFLAAIRNLVTALEAREAALKDERVAHGAERGRWSAYYAARLTRAQTECSIIRGTPPAPRAAPKGKQP